MFARKLPLCLEFEAAEFLFSFADKSEGRLGKFNTGDAVIGRHWDISAPLMSLLAFCWCHCEFLPWSFSVLVCMNGVLHFISGATKKSDSFNMGKLLWVYCAKLKHANTGPSVASQWELLQRVRDGSVSWRSHRLPFCVTLWCVITSRIIGSVGGNTKRGYWGQSDSGGKNREVKSSDCDAAPKWPNRFTRSHFDVVIGFSPVTFMDAGTCISKLVIGVLLISIVCHQNSRESCSISLYCSKFAWTEETAGGRQGAEMLALKGKINDTVSVKEISLPLCFPLYGLIWLECAFKKSHVHSSLIL